MERFPTVVITGRRLISIEKIQGIWFREEKNLTENEWLNESTISLHEEKTIWIEWITMRQDLFHPVTKYYARSSRD